jgi:flagellar hook-associated protein 2
LTAKQQAISNIHEKLNAFKSYLEVLSNDATYETLTANVSDSDVISVTVENGAVEASYDVEVLQVAEGNTFKVGTVSTITDIDQSISQSGTLTVNYLKDGSSTSFSVDYGGKTLRQVMDDINSSGDLKASIVNLGTASSPDYQLIISPVETGLDNRITGIDDSLNPGDDSAGVFSEDSSKTYETASAQDAKIKIDGIEFQNSSNVFEDVIYGVTITANKSGTSELEIVKDNSTVQSNIESIVSAYNDLLDTVSSATGTQGALSGESSLNTMVSTIFGIIADNLGRYGFIDTEGTAETTQGHLIIKDEAFETFMEREDAKDIVKNFASSLSSYIETYDTNLENQEQRYSEQISDISERISSLTNMIDKEIERMRLKFAQLETYLSQMQSIQARIQNFIQGLSSSNDQNR